MRKRSAASMSSRSAISQSRRAISAFVMVVIRVGRASSPPPLRGDLSQELLTPQRQPQMIRQVPPHQRQYLLRFFRPHLERTQPLGRQADAGRAAAPARHRLSAARRRGRCGSRRTAIPPASARGNRPPLPAPRHRLHTSLGRARTPCSSSSASAKAAATCGPSTPAASARRLVSRKSNRSGAACPGSVARAVNSAIHEA